MNTTLPTMSLGLLGGAFTDAVGSGQNPAALGGLGALTADAKGAFDVTLKSALDEVGDLRDAADARDAKDSADEAATAAVTTFQPPAHLLAALVNAPPPELGNAANEAPPLSGKSSDVTAAMGATSAAPGATGGTATLGRPEFTQELAQAGDSVGPGGGAKGVAIPVAMTAASGTYDKPLPKASREAGPSDNAVPPAVDALSTGFDPSQALAMMPAAEGAQKATSYDWKGGDFGANAVITATPARPTTSRAALAADGFSPHSPTVSSTALTNALGDGSFANHIIGAKPAAQDKPAVAASAPPATPADPATASAVTTPEVVGTAPEAASAKSATAPQPVAATAAAKPANPTTVSTAINAKNVKSVAGRAGKAELTDKASDDEEDVKAELTLGASSQESSTNAANLPDAVTPTPMAHAPKAHEPSVKTVTAQNPAPTAPSDSAQEAVRVAETVGHKRFLASGEARGHIDVEGLGRIEVRAHTEHVGPVGSAVQVSVQVDDAQARAVVQQHASELRAHVQADVPNANVHLDSRNAGTASNHGQSSNGGSSNGREQGASRGADDSVQGTNDGAVQRQVFGQKGAARYVL